MQETWVQYLGQEDPQEKEMATHSSTLAWKIPWTEEPTAHGVSESLTWLSDFPKECCGWFDLLYIALNFLHNSKPAGFLIILILS